jgi:hypothetical protein
MDSSSLEDEKAKKKKKHNLGLLNQNNQKNFGSW